MKRVTVARMLVALVALNLVVRDFTKPFEAGGGEVLSALRSRESGQGLKESLLAISTFDGLQGEIRFDAYGDVVPSLVSIRIICNRKFVVVE